MTSSSNWRDLIHCLTSGLNLTTFLLLFPIVLVSPGNAQTLKAVKERGALNCGVSQGLLGFSNADDKNNWSGFDVDFCRAVAAAIFDDPSKVAFVPLDAPARFTALQSNKIDVLSRNTTWTMSRENHPRQRHEAGGEPEGFCARYAAARYYDQHFGDRLRADRATSDDALQGREVGSVR